MKTEDLLPCPNCNSQNLKDCYVYIKCESCLMTGPQMNGGRNDDHADNGDHTSAINAWNKLPRRKKFKRVPAEEYTNFGPG